MRPAQLGVRGRGEQREEKQNHSITIGKAGAPVRHSQPEHRAQGGGCRAGALISARFD
jgi:hypothetical protein